MDHRKDQPPLSDPPLALGAEAQEMEAALRQFAPRALHLERERLMFLAGRAAAEAEAPARSRWRWQAATVGLGAVAASLALALGIQLTRPPVERIVYRDRPVPQIVVQPAPAPPPFEQPAIVATTTVVDAERQTSSPWWPSLAEENVLKLRNVVLRWGVEALPTSGAAKASPSSQPTSVELWQEFRGPLGANPPSL
jgi:hypothetical protein